LLVGLLVFSLVGAGPALQGTTVSGEAAAGRWNDYLPVSVLIGVAVLVIMSAFFSGSETAFFSIHRIRLRAMREEPGVAGRLVASMMDRPGQLLATILIGNEIVNVLIAVLLGTRTEDLLTKWGGLPEPAGYALAVLLCTAFLVFFGEVTPKVIAVRMDERFARTVAIPLRFFDKTLAPIRDGFLKLTDGLFKLTRFHELRAAPFITDDEFKSVLTDGEAQGVIEEDERQMIQGILEFSDATLREILVPRPDVIALPEDASVADALAVAREHDFSRFPVYEDDLDHVSGLLVIKDLLPSFSKGDLERKVGGLKRPPHFVPEVMTVHQFVRDAQRHRTHLAIVVDEYGGTSGIVTLEDAVEQVVGDIMDEDEVETLAYRVLGPNTYEVEGGLSLDEFNELVHANLEDEEHETVAGFLMNQIEKVPEPGDEIECDGIRFTVQACEGRRVSTLRIQMLPERDADKPGGNKS
jgi:putative hemolysin